MAQVVLAEMAGGMPEAADDDLQPQRPAAQPWIPGWLRQVLEIDKRTSSVSSPATRQLSARPRRPAARTTGKARPTDGRPRRTPAAPARCGWRGAAAPAVGETRCCARPEVARPSAPGCRSSPRSASARSTCSAVAAIAISPVTAARRPPLLVTRCPRRTWPLSAVRLHGHELQRVIHDDRDLVKAQGLQAVQQRRGIDRVVGVVSVEMVQVVAGQAVRADQHAAWPQDPEGFGEDLVLHRCRRYVMQHREAPSGIEGRIGVAQPGSAAGA